MHFVKTRKQILKFVQKKGICAELGVFRGRYAEHILRILNPGLLYLIDGWDTIDHVQPADTNGERWHQNDLDRWKEIRQDVEKRFEDYPNVEIRCGDTAREISKFPDRFFDFVYVDADHSRRGCLRDLSAAAPKIRPGGILGGHDFCVTFPGVIDAVLTFARQHPNFVPFAMTTELKCNSFLFRSSPVLLL